jgi:hypothetical protein
VIGHTELTQQRLFVCRVPSGVWAGEPTTLDSQPEMLLAVKTFLGPKELR